MITSPKNLKRILVSNHPELWYGILFTFVSLLFLILKLSFLSFKFSDENTYFYMAYLVTKGYLPYRDFFLANPPLQVYLLAFGQLFIGKNYLLLKIGPLLASLITAGFIFLVGKKIWSVKEGFWAALLFLFSFIVLTTTDHSTGVHLTTMFLTILLYLILREKPLLAGLTAALALCVRLYAGFPIIAILAYLLWKKKNLLFKFIVSMSLPILFICSAMQLVSHGAFLDQIIFFRLHLVNLIGIEKIKIFLFFLQWDFMLLGLVLIFIATRNKKNMSLFLLILGTLCVFYFVYQDLYYLYLLPTVPILSLLAAHTLHELNTLSKKLTNLVLVVLCCIIPFTSYFYIVNHSQTATINNLDQIVNFVKTNTPSSQTIFGSFEITPLVALLSEIPISNQIVDTNEKNYLTGKMQITMQAPEICKDIAFIFTKNLVTRDGTIINPPLYIEQTLLASCSPLASFPIQRDYLDNTVLLYDCRNLHQKEGQSL